MKSKRVGLGLGLIGAVLVASPAAAATRYAEPQGNGAASSCPRSNPCNIEDAVQDSSVQDGDTVVVRPGRYEIAGNGLDVDRAVDLGGKPGRPRPELVDSGVTLDVIADAHVHDLSLESQATFALLAFAGDPVVERVVVRSASTACHPPETPGVLRDSVCISTGPGVAAISAIVSGSRTQRFRLRNVTAIGTGASSDGIRFSNHGPVVRVDARNVIASGVGADISASAGGSDELTIGLVTSNYDIADVNGAAASVTPPGSGTNQIALPLLADPERGDFHQLPGSPTVDAGAPTSFLGDFDFDRQPRVQGTAPDIGADELDNTLRLKLKAKRRQRIRRLSIKAACPEEDCRVEAIGKVRAGGKRLRTRRVERIVPFGEQQKLRLRLRRRQRGRLAKLLEESIGRVRVEALGTDPAGVVTERTKKIKLKE